MKDRFKTKRAKRQKRARRIRAKIFGVANRPRLSVFRSNQHIYVQLIDDEKGKTIASAADLEIKKSTKGKIATASLVGQLIAKKAAELKIKEVIFDKRAYKYHGLVKAVAEGARKGGLKF